MVCSFVFFWIFKVLAIWSRPCKNLENQKKQKKQNCRPHWGSCLTLWTCGLQFCFFVFFGFSRFWPSGADHAKTSKIQKKTKKTKLQTPLGLLSDSVDMWSAVFFLDFRGSGHMWSAVLFFFLDFRGSGHLEQTIDFYFNSKLNLIKF